MTANEYQEKAVSFKLPTYDLEAMFCGLASEAGEVLGVRQKFIRDADKECPDTFLSYISKLERELGDIVWHIAAIAEFYEISLQDVMEENIKKLNDRKNRGKITGSGDER